MSLQVQRFLPLPFFLSLTGILFSLWNIWGDSSALCVTEGCSLFQNFTVAGFSLWWAGVAAFATLLLCAALGWRGAGLILSGTGLVLDCFLLLIMLMTAPCFNCIVIGLWLALTYMAYRSAMYQNQRRRGPTPTSILFVVWALFFVVNVGTLAHDGMGPWVMEDAPGAGNSESGSGPATVLTDAPVHIYFSPSCSACRALAQSPTVSSVRTAWYPVAEDTRDVWMIADMSRRLREGAKLADALNGAIAAAPAQISPFELVNPSMLLLQFRLWRNMAHVLNAGSQRLPFVEFRGAPSVLMPAPVVPASGSGVSSSAGGVGSGQSTGESAPGRANDGHLPFLSVTGFCDGGTEPCSDLALPSSSLSGPVSPAP